MPGISRGNLSTVLRRVVNSLRRGRVSYVIIGAWALSAWGKPRATADLDFLVFVNEEEFNRLSRLMTGAGLEIDESWQQWNPMLRDSQLRFQYRGVAIDFLRPRDSHDQGIFRRRRKKRLGRQYYWVVSPEDFILQKLKVGRPRDFEDALSVIERSGSKLNRKYLREWAGRIGVAPELNYIVRL